MLAARHGSVECLNVLLNAGANANLVRASTKGHKGHYGIHCDWRQNPYAPDQCALKVACRYTQTLCAARLVQLVPTDQVLQCMRQPDFEHPDYVSECCAERISRYGCWQDNGEFVIAVLAATPADSLFHTLAPHGFHLPHRDMDGSGAGYSFIWGESLTELRAEMALRCMLLTQWEYNEIGYSTVFEPSEDDEVLIRATFCADAINHNPLIAPLVLTPEVSTKAAKHAADVAVRFGKCRNRTQIEELADRMWKDPMVATIPTRMHISTIRLIRAQDRKAGLCGNTKSIFSRLTGPLMMLVQEWVRLNALPRGFDVHFDMLHALQDRLNELRQVRRLQA